MSPAAVYAAPVATTDSQKVVTAVPIKGPALVVGSPATATEGKYQSLITDLEKTRAVEKQMVDRLLDGGEYTTYDSQSD